MAPKTIWSSLSRRSSEVPTSDDRTMRVMLWERQERRNNESKPGKQGREENSRLFWIPTAGYILPRHSSHTETLLIRRHSHFSYGDTQGGRSLACQRSHSQGNCWPWRAGKPRGRLQQSLSAGPWPCCKPPLGDLSWKLFHTTMVSSVLAEFSCTSRFCPNMWTPLREPITENGSWGKVEDIRQGPPIPSPF